MKIAVPTRDGVVDDHFGHCKEFTVFTIEENKVVATNIVPSVEGCGCKSNIASTLRQIGVSVMLAGNMGDGAVNVLNAQNIKAIRGCSGAVENVVNDYLNGKLVDSKLVCDHHNCHNH